MNLSERYQNKLAKEQRFEEVGLDHVLLQMEVTNACNHRCYFCPNADSIRPTKMMGYDFAERIMKECADFLGNGKKICFHMNGEPLLYKRLSDLVKLSKELGYEYSFVTTNGSVAADGLLKDLFDAGLDSIKFSINAGTKESYLKIHGRDDFEKAVHALEFASAYREESGKDYKIFDSCVGTKDNYSELEDFAAYAEPLCDEIVFYYPCGYAGQNNELAKELRCDLSGLDIKTFDIKHTCPCPVLWNSINVTCEGFLALCCSESDNRLIVEDLNKKGVREAWLGKKMQAIRALHTAGNIRNTPCFSCISETVYEEEETDKELFALALEQRKQNTRIKKNIANIDYDQTLNFFNRRADKYKEENPYSVTMYQDNNPILVEERNRAETEKLLPLLRLDAGSKVLDLACGIGRWSDAITVQIEEYCGMDFSENLIALAKKRFHEANRSFCVGSVNHLQGVLAKNQKGRFNRILLIGILMYINDGDLLSVMNQLAEVSEDHTVICIREPLGIDERLTLKGFYSEELKDHYNAIYRTRDELMRMLDDTLIKAGFRITQKGFLFSEDELNNRKETAQYYFILER